MGNIWVNCVDPVLDCAVCVNKSDLIHWICDLFAGDPEPAGIKLHPFLCFVTQCGVELVIFAMVAVPSTSSRRATCDRIQHVGSTPTSRVKR
ncbi:hypothetical protein C9J12_15895 [Photobacterium frigidiphilum]|uniref:Uncharacterized protein n=1 Tax=Photobacterium frigidiphilum TaxID=264736 RepID=A0A2T3JEA3_9GAMM|nr:hypothetical protein C9J12_15895 [Photobacterium frigidiphilum]